MPITHVVAGVLLGFVSAAHGSDLSQALLSVDFRNEGVTSSTDDFHWEIVQTVGYKQVPIYLDRVPLASIMM